MIKKLVLVLALGVSACAEMPGSNTPVAPTAESSTIVGDVSDPRNRAKARTELAALYYGRGNMAVALEELRNAVAADPNYPLTHSMFGLVYMELRENVLAEQSFRRALSLAPNDADINHNYGWFLCQTARERQSVDYFKRAAASRTYQTPALPMQNAGLCMLRIRDSKSAEEYFRRAFELDASNPVAKYHLARLYLASQQVERARFYYGLLPRGQDANSEVLWLGVRIARAEGDVRTERELATDLRRRFPDSREAAFLRREVFDE